MTAAASASKRSSKVNSSAALVCKPIQQVPSQCECTHNRTSRPTRFLPRCAASTLCVDQSHRDTQGTVGTYVAGRRLWHSKLHRQQLRIDAALRERQHELELQRLLSLPRPPAAPYESSTAALEPRVTILIAYGHNATRVRYWYSGDPFRSYLNSMRLICRLVLSLRVVGTRLPITLLLSGERHAGFERALQMRLGVSVLGAEDATRHRIRVPTWASHFHKASFIKLTALSLTSFRRVILLDSDSVVFRNIDHLALVPPPAFVFRFKCFRMERKAPPICACPRASKSIGHPSSLDTSFHVVGTP